MYTRTIHMTIKTAFGVTLGFAIAAAPMLGAPPARAFADEPANPVGSAAAHLSATGVRMAR